MDGLEFTSKTIEHLAWPTVVVYLLRTQRQPVSDLIDRIKKLKVGSAEAEVSEKAKDLKEKAEELEAKPVDQPDPEVIKAAEVPIQEKAVLTSSNFSARLHAYTPSERDEQLRASGLIIEQWARLEQTIRYLLSTIQPTVTPGLTISRVLEQLKQLGVMSPELVVLVKDLMKLRNQVAHSQIEPTRTAADDYAASCATANERLAEEHFAWQKAMRELGDEIVAELKSKRVP